MSEENDAVEQVIWEETYGQYFDEDDGYYEPGEYEPAYDLGFDAGWQAGYEQARAERLLPRLRSWFWRIRHDWRMRKIRREFYDIPF